METVSREKLQALAAMLPEQEDLPKTSYNDQVVRRLREGAAQDLEGDRKDRQTTCDRCGSDLGGWSCYSGHSKNFVKVAPGMFPAYIKAG